MGDYRFAWVHLGTAILDFVNSEKRSTVQLEFSRAMIKDRELLIASRETKSESEVAEVEEMVDTLNISQSSTESENAKSTKNNFEIPAQFGKNLNNRKRKKNKKGNYNFNSFENYWDLVSEYLICLTWAQHYGDQMEELARKDLEKRIEDVYPFYFIPEHSDIKENERYKNLTSVSDASTYENLYEMHCKIVKNLCAEDFENYRKMSVSKKAKNFLNEIEKLGFTSGFTKSSFPSTINQNDSEEAKPSSAKEECVFDDLNYSLDMAFERKQRNNYREPDESCKIVEQPEVEVPENSEVSFKFDPEKEKHLIAANAADLYRHDPEIRKYFNQRFRLFSKLNEGIILDREGWFSVTPERIAEHIADRVVQKGITVVVDAFTGVGGNAIQFALKGAYVIAIDLNPVRLKCARHNAAVYGVENYISFICADYFNVAATWANDKQRAPKIDAVFLSPPWGGPSYLNVAEFDLETGCTPNGIEIFDASIKLSKNIAYFLPRNTKSKQLKDLAMKIDGHCEIEQAELNKKIKTITAYYGDLVFKQDFQ